MVKPSLPLWIALALPLAGGLALWPRDTQHPADMPPAAPAVGQMNSGLWLSF